MLVCNNGEKKTPYRLLVAGARLHNLSIYIPFTKVWGDGGVGELIGNYAEHSTDENQNHFSSTIESHLKAHNTQQNCVFFCQRKFIHNL